MPPSSIKSLAIALAVSLSSYAAVAQTPPPVTEKSVTRDGFAFPAKGAVRILIFRPDIKVGEQTTAGLFQPNAEWYENARRELTAALLAAKKNRQFDAILHEEPTAAKAAQYAEYLALFRVIVGSAIRHKLFARDPLPSKADRFDWSLGSGIAQLVADSNADYGLFLFSHDGFESSGRKAAQLVASLMGARDTPGAHLGYAALVDLKSGDLLWLNVDLKATGDVRTAEGAAMRIEQLLAGFPSRARATGSGQ